MECLRCGFSNPAGFKFCGNCGDRLSRICPDCNHENFQRARFCSECGSALGDLCPSCGCSNPQSARFCSECGLQLDKVCSECDTINPLYARFCNICGKALPESDAIASRTPEATDQEIAASKPGVAHVQPQKEADPAVEDQAIEIDCAEQLQKLVPPALRDMYLANRGNVEGERKIVSIVFSEVSGFTALSEKYADEPEEVRQIINECLKRQAEQVHALEGYVDKFVGDELMALFGAPIWHEDDAQRAAMAALRMRDVVEEYSDELEREEGVRLHVHIGINTGKVSVGCMGDDMFMNYTVMGDPVNLASRIKSVARTGEIMVGELTYRPTKAMFAYKEPRYMELKGKSKPQPVYELIGPKDRSENSKGGEAQV